MDLSHSSSYIALIVPHSTTIGVDVAFDAAGSQAGLDAALPSIRVRPRGMFLDIAVFNESPQIIMNLIVLRELSLAGKLSSFTDTSCELIFKIGTAAYNGIHPEMLEAVAAGKFKGIEKHITQKIAIEDLVKKGIMALLHEKDKHGQNLTYSTLTVSAL